MSNSDEKESDLPKKSFEVALGELEALVDSLEQGNVPLEELIVKYERGTKLHAHCQQVLREAELRIERLRVADGKAEFVPLENGPAD